MNEFESALIDKVLDVLHKSELNVVKSVEELRGEIKALGEKGSAEHEALKETVERNIVQDTERLNKHSEQIDTLQDDVSAIKEWKEGITRTITNRAVVIGGAMAVFAAIITFLLGHFF